MKIIELHKSVWKTLQGRRAKLPHALLLSGQKGLGKFELARRFVAGLLCEMPLNDGQACGKCLACNWFSQGNHPDFRLLQPEILSADFEAEEGKKKPSQQITIDQIRGLDEFFNVGTHRGGLRIILVNPTEAMNRNAANALLKTLEEPSDKTLFILVSSDPARLLPTIRSRCQVVPVPVPEFALASQIMAGDGMENPERWLALAGGSPLLAAEMASGKQGNWLEALANRLAAAQLCDPLAAAGEFEKQIKDSKGKLQLKHLVEAQQKWLVDLTLAANGLPLRYFLDRKATMTKLADMIPATRLIQLYRATGTRRQEAEQPLNARLFLEGLFLEYRALFSK